MTQQSADNCIRIYEDPDLPPFIELSSVDSTNNYALQLIRNQQLKERQNILQHGLAIFAHEQYAGKGQRGKTWSSAKDENIHLSTILDPLSIRTKPPFTIIAIVALAVRNFLEHLTQSDIYIKWPNDIYFNDRKLGGILIENIITGTDWRWAVAGVGINTNQTTFEDVLKKRAVSLKQITGQKYDCLKIAKGLRAALLNTFANSQSLNIIAAYNQFLYKRNKNVTFLKDGKMFEAVVKSVSPKGQLLLQTDVDLYFDFGEIQWV